MIQVDSGSAMLGALIMLTALLVFGALVVFAALGWLRAWAARLTGAFTDVSARRAGGRVVLSATVVDEPGRDTIPAPALSSNHVPAIGGRGLDAAEN